MTQARYRHQYIKEAVSLVAVELQTNNELVDAILSQVIIEAMKRYQQKINVGVQDSVSDLLDTFKQKITESVFSTADTWQEASGRDPILYPKGCRFCYVRGDSTIVVIEEDPKVRSLSFEGNMLGIDSLIQGSGQQRVGLSLPYVVFLVLFRNGIFISLYSGWRTRPLTGLDDLLYKPLLPNIHNNMQVCLGLVNVEGDVSAVSQSVITNFWNSRFNSDLSDTWWDKGIVSSHLRSATTWEEKTEENPMFILDLDLSKVIGSRTVQYLLDLLCKSEESPDESGFRHRISEDIDKCVDALFHKIMRYFKKTKFDRHYPKDIVESLGRAAQEAFGELSDVVSVLEREVDKLSYELQEESQEIVNKSISWKNYIRAGIEPL